MTFLEEVQRRRTFAIISHPDAGKTTLTEKLLLYGGAIHLAGSVKSRKTAKHAVSDWMEIEKQRGISVTSSVLQFDYDGCRVNIPSMIQISWVSCKPPYYKCVYLNLLLKLVLRSTSCVL